MQLALTAVIGTFSHRTRTATALQEVLESLGQLDLLHLLDEHLPAGPTSKLIRLRMIDLAAVSEVIEALRAHRVQTEHSEAALWASRARSPAEAARTAPVARGVRLLRDWVAGLEARTGRDNPRLEIEGHYPRGGSDLHHNHRVADREAASDEERGGDLDDRPRAMELNTRAGRSGGVAGLPPLTKVERCM